MEVASSYGGVRHKRYNGQRDWLLNQQKYLIEILFFRYKSGINFHDGTTLFTSS